VYTSHGHHIEGTPAGKKPEQVARCGGPGVCTECSKEASREQNIQKVLVSDVTEGDRLSAEDFLEMMRTAPAYHVIHSSKNDAVLELYVIDGSEVTHYLSPDFIKEPGEEVAAFFTEFNKISKTPEAIARRFQKWQP
jgi:hypothetical protein